MTALRCLLLVIVCVGSSFSGRATELQPAFVPDELIVAFDVSPGAIGLRPQVERALLEHAHVELKQSLSGVVGAVVRLKPGTTFGAAFQAIQRFSFADFPGWSLRTVEPNSLVWIDPPTLVRRISNVSNRAEVQSGERVMISGCIIPGPLPQLVAVKVRGPSLDAMGVDGVLADPRLTLYRGDQSLLANENWGTLREFERSLARTLIATPDDAREPLLVTYLDPGAYTAVVSGAEGAAGVALIEFYLLDEFFVN